MSEQQTFEINVEGYPTVHIETSIEPGDPAAVDWPDHLNVRLSAPGLSVSWEEPDAATLRIPPETEKAGG
jgi:hypothetical protein